MPSRVSREWPIRLLRLFVTPLDRTRELSITKQTELSWAKAVLSYEEVPPAYRSFFMPLEAAGIRFPYAILTPTYEGFLHPAAERLVCILGPELHILKKSGGGFHPLCYPQEDIQRVETRSILLDSRIRIFGSTREGAPAVETLRFNSVTDTLMKPLLAWMRGLEGEAAPEEKDKFDGWMDVSHKFMSFARRGLMGGETVLLAVLQPAIGGSWTLFPGVSFRRTVSPAHAVILTDRELILIREEKSYGGTWQCLPLRPAATLSLGERKDGLLMFAVRTADGARLEFLFERAARGGLDDIVARWRGTTAGQPGATAA